jgi:UPF0755 protein
MAEDENPGIPETPSPPGRRPFRLIGAAVLAASLLTGWLWMDYRHTVDNPLGAKAGTVFEIAKGEGLAAIARNLEDQGILAKPLWFKALAYAEGVHHRIKYGEYEIPPDSTPRSLLAMLVAGKVRQHPVTVVEGWTFAEMLAALTAHPALAHQAAGQPPEEIMAGAGRAVLPRHLFRRQGHARPRSAEARLR